MNALPLLAGPGTNRRDSPESTFNKTCTAAKFAASGYASLWQRKAEHRTHVLQMWTHCKMKKRLYVGGRYSTDLQRITTIIAVGRP